MSESIVIGVISALATLLVLILFGTRAGAGFAAGMVGDYLVTAVVVLIVRRRRS